MIAWHKWILSSKRERRFGSAFGLSEGSGYESCEGCVSHDERGGGKVEGCTSRALTAEDQSIVDKVMRMLAA